METYTSEDDDEEDEDEDKKKKKEESLGEALNENDADFHDHVARIFSNKVWAVNQALDLKGLQFLSRGNNRNWNIEDPDLFANGQRVYVLMDKTNREKYLARLNTDGELVTVDERGKNVPDIEYFGGPDVRELIDEGVEEVIHTEQGHEAYLMNEVISGMNDEGAYYESGWLYDWSDGTDEEDVEDYFGSKDPENEEAFNDLKDAYLRIYKHYHNGGLYNCRPEVVDYAHKTDAELGLSPIENLIPNKPQVRESLEVNELADVFNSIVDPDKIKVIEFHDVSKDGKRKLYEGAFDDAPFGLGGCPCKGFDTANHNLNCTIDSEGNKELNPNTLAGALKNFSDDNTDKIHVWDDVSGNEVFKGNKKDAIAKFGDKSFVAFDAPKVLRVYILAPHVIGTDDEEETEGEQKLINDIIKANDLSTYKLDDKSTNEYWIKQSIHEDEDLDYIYETYIKPTKNDKLREEFTKVTGYYNELDEAYLAGLVEGKESEQPNVEASMAKMTKLVKSEIVKLENDLKKLEATAKKNNPDVEKQKAVLKDIEDQKARIKKWKSFIGESVKPVNEAKEEKTKANNDGTVAVIAGPNTGIVVSNRCASVGKPFTVYAQSLETLEEFEIELPITIQDVADYLAYIATEPYTQDEVDEYDIIAEVVADKQIAYDEFEDIFEDNHADEIDVQVEQLEDESKEDGNYLTPQEDEWENDRIEEDYIEPNYGYDTLEDGSLKVNKGINKGLIVSDDCDDVGSEVIIHCTGLDYEFEKEYDDASFDYDFWGEQGTYYAPGGVFGGKVDEYDLLFTITKADLAYYLAYTEVAFTQDQINDGIYDTLTPVERGSYDAGIEELHSDETYEQLDQLAADGELDDYVDESVDKEPDYEDYNESVTTSYKTRKELSEAIEQCKNNNRPYTVRRSLKEGYRYDITEENDVTKRNGSVNTTSSDLDRAIVSKIAAVSKDIADILKDHYHLEVNPSYIVADIARDLRLISGQITPDQLGDLPSDIATTQMYGSYNEFFNFLNEILTVFTGRGIDTTPTAKLTYAMRALNSPAFSKEKIEQALKSPRFAQALEAGAVPCIGHEAQHQVEAPTSVEFDDKHFDEDINDYFDEAYDKTILYSTLKGSVDKKGNIMLEGILNCEGVVKDIKFTLTPTKPLSENYAIASVSDKEQMIKNTTYKVSNNISEEVFEYSNK